MADADILQQNLCIYQQILHVDYSTIPAENLAKFSLKILSIKQNKPLKQSLIKLFYLLNYLNYMNLLSKNGDIS